MNWRWWPKKCVCPTEAELSNPRIAVMAGNCARHGHYSYGPAELRALREPVVSLVDDTIAALDRELVCGRSHHQCGGCPNHPS